MSKLPSLSYREVAAKLRRAGFVHVRTGKHDVYVNTLQYHYPTIQEMFPGAH